MTPFRISKAAYAYEWWSMEFPPEAEDGEVLADLELTYARAHLACDNLALLERAWGQHLDFYTEDFEAYFGVRLTRRAARMHLRKFIRRMESPR